jgi:hypothetical protein
LPSVGRSGHRICGLRMRRMTPRLFPCCPANDNRFSLQFRLIQYLNREIKRIHWNFSKLLINWNFSKLLIIG